MDRRNILDCGLQQLVEVVCSYGEKKFRAAQIFGWLARGTESFDDMGNIPKPLRSKLEEDWYIGLPEVVVAQKSGEDGTRKVLFQFRDGARVESVFMKYHYGNSICISSQVGCRMGCAFCASTKKGLDRSLTGGEMLGQVLAMEKFTGEKIGHVVVMGIGEPFDNYDNLSDFIHLINDPKGFGLGMRNITVSTCGLVPYITRFGKDFSQANLAVSLHAPNGEIRQRTMPVARRYGYEELMDACRRYTEDTGRRITFEYAMIRGVNDSREDALELAGHLEGWLTHVNLIPLNPVEGTGMSASYRESILRFKEILEKRGIAVTIRRTLGSDIDGACGQLRLR